MNALYVIVSIHILMVLARLNHAYGLSTFGIKSGSQAQGTPSGVGTNGSAEGTPCSNQSNCAVEGTTCIRNLCLCGDNLNPSNGVCKPGLKGAKHICKKDEECVAGADCQESKDPKIRSKTCQCQEGLTEMPSGTCS
ncbi:hypothetical protein NQ318_001722, partial [Aromia moschata]